MQLVLYVRKMKREKKIAPAQPVSNFSLENRIHFFFFESMNPSLKLVININMASWLQAINSHKRSVN